MTCSRETIFSSVHPSNSLVSALSRNSEGPFELLQGALQGPSACGTTEKRVLKVRNAALGTSRTTDINLDCGSVKNTLVFVVL